MKQIILSVFFITCLQQAFSATYYFSSLSGDDARTNVQAQSASAPWKSLSKLNSFFSNIQPGDSILFKRGETFYGSIIVIKSGTAQQPIYFGGYGSGMRPIITGFTQLSNLKNSSANIWETNLPQNKNHLNIVLVNDVMQTMGRYPNSNTANMGYLNIATASSNKSITGADISSLPDFTGGEIVIRKNRWVLDRNAITAQSGNTITYISESNYGAAANYGYFIQNHPKTLDTQGEWYYQATVNNFGVYLSSAADANNIKVTTGDTLVTAINQSNLVFNSISFRGANMNAFELKNGSNINISTCEFFYSGINAVNASNITNLAIVNSYINHSNNIALNLNNCVNTSVTNNRIDHTGNYVGIGSGNSGSYEAIMIIGSNNTIQQNQVLNTGYIPVTFSGNNITVKNNYIANYAFIKDDGAGIYTWNNAANAVDNTNRIVSNNIVINGKGAGAGTDNPANLYAHGIYLDDNSAGVQVLNNTVANCAAYGVFVHNAHSIQLLNNTVYNNKVQLVMQHDNVAASKLVYNNTVTGNILFSKTTAQTVAAYKTTNDDISNFGTFNNNYYCRPLDNDLIINIAYAKSGTNYNQYLSLDAWKQQYGKDNASVISPVTYSSYAVQSLIGSNKFTNGDFDKNVSGLYSYAKNANSILSWSAGQLDGGSLKLNFLTVTGNSNYASLIMGAGSVVAKKNYILRFSMLGSNSNNSISAYLRKSLAPYNDLTARQLFTQSKQRIQKEFLFTPSASESNASIVFDVPEQTGAVYFDNISLYEASVTNADTANLFRFEYNNTTVAKNITLNDSYVDVKNNIVSGSITLQPYTSVILLSQKKSEERKNNSQVIIASIPLNLLP